MDEFFLGYELVFVKKILEQLVEMHLDVSYKVLINVDASSSITVR